MLSLRSARGRGVLASAVLILVLVTVAIVAVLRVRQHQHRLLALEDTATAAVSLEHVRAQLFRELAALSGLVFSDDATLVDDYREAAAALEWDLNQARTEGVGTGRAGYVATLGDVTERIGNFNQTANTAIPLLLEGDPQTRVQVVAAVMPQIWVEVDAIVADLDQLAEDERTELAAERATATNAADVTIWIVVGFGGIALLMATGVVVVIIASVVRPLVSLRASARAITSGDLAARAKVFGPEEVASLARDFNEMTEALSAKTKEYIDTTNLTGDIIAKLDKDGRLTFVNDGACQFFGRPREELLGTDGMSLLHPDDLERVVHTVRETIERKELVKGFVSRLVTPMGARVVEWNGCPRFDEEGQYAGLQITARDVTDREKAEEALRESEERLRTLVTNVPVILFAVDRAGKLTLSEGKVLEGLGLRPGEVVGRSVLEAFGDTPQVAEYMQRALAGEAFTAMVEVAGLVFETHHTPIRDQDGEVSGVIGVAVDITERKRAEEAVRQAEQRYRALFEEAPVMYVIVRDQEGVPIVADCNQLFLSTLGYTRAEVLERPLAGFYTAESRAELLEGGGFQRGLKGQLAEEERQLLTRDGTVVEALLRAEPEIDPDGHALGTRAMYVDITERKKAEDALLAKTKEYIDTTNLTGDMIAKVDEHGKWAFLNDAACQFFGKPREELLGTYPTALVHPEDVEATVQVVQEGRARTEPVRGFVNRQLTPMGIRVVEWNGCSVFAEDGRYAGIQISGRDITDRKRAEEELESSEERLKILFEAAPDAYYLSDLEGNIVDGNRAAEELLGYKREELIGKNIFEVNLLLPDQISKATEGFAQNARGKAVGPNEFTLIEKDGNQIAVEIRAFPVRIKDQTLVLGVARDITERKRAEEAVRESEARYRLLAENTSDLIWIMDMGLRYTYMSPSVTRMRGYTVEEIVGASIAETMTSASIEAARKALAEELAMERMDQKDIHRSRKLEFEMYCKDGSTIWTEMNMTFLRDSEGKPTGILGVTRDISERKKAEEERERLLAELEVRAITDSLTGLYDHAHFYQRLSEEIDRSKRYNHGFAVVMMDVDDFKRFNDSRGHQAGDGMLRLVADCIRSGVRSSDIAFRYGGDEFAAILPHADSSKARAAVERINGRITKRLKQIDGGSAVRLSLSAGVACFPDDGTAADDLVRLADAALYSAKWVARARDIMGQREDIQSLISALVSRRGGVEGSAGGAIFRPEALHEQQARIVSSVASSIAVALKDAGVCQALEDPDLQVLATVGAAAEIKDRYIRGHPERTSEGAAALAEEMGLSPERVRDIRIAGLLHDIGKVTVSESILNKPGKLTKREFASIKAHPIVGASLVSQVKGFERLVPIVRHHHERFDSKGYPDGLTGEEIPLEARILSVVDVFDALKHQRSYREAMSSEEAIAELERGAGTQFDSAVVEAFLALVKTRGDELTAFAQAASADR